jgi:hypothetical protein
MDSITIYKYDELSTEEAKEKAREQVRNHLHETFDNSSLSKDFDESLSDAGYPYMKIEFSLNYSQGDGMAFYGTVNGNDVLALAERLLDPAEYHKFQALHSEADFTVEITRNSYGYHYSHFNTMTVDVDCTNDYNDEAYNSDVHKLFCDLVDADVREVSKRLAKDGYAEIEYQTSDEQVLERIKDNDQWRFEEDGTMR